MKKTTLILFCLATVLSAQGQLRNNDVYEVKEMNQSVIRSEIRIPGFDGMQTLKCDFHIHTVFSDGLVWPDIRVTEAWEQGLDAIAITDHIEYRPFKEVVRGDLNESFTIAKKKGEAIDFIVIKGTEITRSKPLGHLNALFVQDVMPMDVEDPLKAIDEAVRQGAFVMWNHPGWPDDKTTLYPVHEELIRDKKIHGVEVFNHMEYYPASLDWCKNMDLAFMGNSDVHGLIRSDYGEAIRPMTLVFAREKSEEAIKEALFAGRTAAYYHHELAGPEEYLRPLVQACLNVRAIKEDAYEITNISDIPFSLTTDGLLYLIPAGKTIRFIRPKAEHLTVENCYIGTAQKLTLPVAAFLGK